MAHLCAIFTRPKPPVAHHRQPPPPHRLPPLATTPAGSPPPPSPTEMPLLSLSAITHSRRLLLPLREADQPPARSHHLQPSSPLFLLLPSKSSVAAQTTCATEPAAVAATSNAALLPPSRPPPALPLAATISPSPPSIAHRPAPPSEVPLPIFPTAAAGRAAHGHCLPLLADQAASLFLPLQDPSESTAPSSSPSPPSFPAHLLQSTMAPNPLPPSSPNFTQAKARHCLPHRQLPPHRAAGTPVADPPLAPPIAAVATASPLPCFSFYLQPPAIKPSPEPCRHLPPPMPTTRIPSPLHHLHHTTQGPMVAAPLCLLPHAKIPSPLLHGCTTTKVGLPPCRNHAREAMPISVVTIDHQSCCLHPCH